MTNLSLKHLNLRANQLGVEGKRAVAEAVADLHSPNLDGNGIGAKGRKTVANSEITSVR